MRVFVYNRYLDLSSNVSIIKKWDCKVCGKENGPQERVDTQKPFGLDEESFCIPCWLGRLSLI